MADVDTRMDYEAVQGYAESFGNMGEIFKKTAQVLQAAIMILRATAFIGLFGNAALERYLSGIKPHIDKLTVTCGEFDQDLRAAIAEHQEADASSGQQFAAS